MSADGTKLYASDTDNGIIYQYTLSTPFDISTTSYNDKSLDTTDQTSNGD